MTPAHASLGGRGPPNGPDTHPWPDKAATGRHGPGLEPLTTTTKEKNMSTEPKPLDVEGDEQ